MNPITFREIGRLDGVQDPSDEELALVAPKDCPERGPEGRKQTALCNLLGRECNRTVSVGETVCRVCLSHGPAVLAKNPYLVKQIVQVAFSSTIAGREAEEPKTPTGAELAVAVANIKTHRGREVARRFVDALVYNQSATPMKAVELLDTYALVEVAP